jgi:hypothetical protein
MQRDYGSAEIHAVKEGGNPSLSPDRKHYTIFRGCVQRNIRRRAGKQGRAALRIPVKERTGVENSGIILIAESHAIRRLEQRLLVGVRGKTEAKEAVRGGARIVDVGYPASAPGTPYPLNILAVREALPAEILVATNIGSISREELPGLWAAGVDAVCIRGAACRPGSGPGCFGAIPTARVSDLVTPPGAAQPEPSPLAAET